jgi:hypothetical protein
MVSVVDLMEAALHPVLTELQADLKMDSDVMEAAKHLPVFTALLTAVRVVSVDLLQTLMELLVADKEVWVELLAALRAALVDLLQVRTELLVVDRAVLDRAPQLHLPAPTERLVVVKMVSVVEVQHLLALTVHQIAEAAVSGSELERVPAAPSLRLDPFRAPDMEVLRAMMDLL